MLLSIVPSAARGWVAVLSSTTSGSSPLRVGEPAPTSSHRPQRGVRRSTAKVNRHTERVATAVHWLPVSPKRRTSSRRKSSTSRATEYPEANTRMRKPSYRGLLRSRTRATSSTAANIMS